MAQTAHSKSAGVQAELIASLLFRYPEICSIKIQPRKGVITLTFLPKGKIGEDDWRQYRKALQDSLEAYHKLRLCPMAHLSVSRYDFDDYCLMEVTRDLATLQREELSLVVAMVREFSRDGLMMDACDVISSDDLEWQDELIDHMLEDVRTKKRCQDIVAFREAGRVVVFDRTDLIRSRNRRKPDK